MPRRGCRVSCGVVVVVVCAARWLVQVAVGGRGEGSCREANRPARGQSEPGGTRASRTRSVAHATSIAARLLTSLSCGCRVDSCVCVCVSLLVACVRVMSRRCSGLPAAGCDVVQFGSGSWLQLRLGRARARGPAEDARPTEDNEEGGMQTDVYERPMGRQSGGGAMRMQLNLALSGPVEVAGELRLGVWRRRCRHGRNWIPATGRVR